MNIPDEVVAAVVAEMERHYITEQKNLGYYRTETVCACGELWMSGDHDGDPDFDEQLYRHGALVIAPLVAEWARKEALREAAKVLRGEGEPGHAGEFLSVNHAQELILELAEGTQS